MVNEHAQEPRSVRANDAPTPRGGGAVLRVTRIVNPLVLRFAGTRWLPLYGVIEHRGRRSGKVYRTPVVVRSTNDGFIVPMPWGQRTDWYRNVRAAGECAIHWKGRDYALTQPELMVNPTAEQTGFSAVQRAIIARAGITHFLHLRLPA